jgi:predicted O-methyltransferase YrrM
MPRVLIDGLDEYLTGLIPERDEVVTEMEEVARKGSIPIIGPLVGRFLYQIGLLTGARTVFEMGSAIGYSTIWWARAVGPEGKVYYTDGNPDNAARARGYLERAGVLDRVEILVGDALDLLSKHEGICDIIFNDVDKHDYPKVFHLALPKISRGGLLITDNTLWSGRVATETDDVWTNAIQEYNRLCFASEDLWTTIVPLRDGVAVSVKR